ncbi:MAG: glycosyltransferase family 1 protein [Chloroflexi bacterium]|nr:MAG: glycosyltransferase family 1 protein [Chloroflexota bacterium]
MSLAIAFFRLRPEPPANQSMARQLQQTFPEYKVEVIDVARRIKQNRPLVALGLLAVLKTYGPRAFLKKSQLRRYFFRTPFIFRAIKLLAADYVKHGNYAFSFQMQSIFDASTPGLPHFVYTDHTHLANLDYPHFDRREMFAGAWIKLEKTIYHNATANFTRSSNISRSVIEQYACPADRVRLVYAGSNVQIKNAALDNNGYRNKNILFVGIDWQRKGGPVLVQAFERVRRIHADAHLTIVGCSPAVNVPNCHVVGPVPLETVEHYYRRASVFCLPTKVEPFGIVFVEAQNYGLPVVAARVGAVPDMVIDGETGYTVAPGDAEALAERLIDLLNDPTLCRAFGRAGAQLTAARYNWQRVGQRMRRVIVPALAKIPPPSRQVFGNVALTGV